MMLLTLCMLLIVIAAFSIIQHFRTRHKNQLGVPRRERKR